MLGFMRLTPNALSMVYQVDTLVAYQHRHGANTKFVIVIGECK